MPYNLDSANSRLVVVGAGDTALHYIGNWSQDSEEVSEETLWKKTTCLKSTTPSDSVSFGFYGTRILLDIVLTPNTSSSPPIIQWFIDDKPPTTIGIQTTSSNSSSFQTLVDDPNLSDSLHTINVTVMQVSSDHPFLLNSFAFSPSSKFWTEAPLTPPDTDPSMAVTIVSGILGGVVLALACILFTLWLRRRRERRFLYSTISEPKDDGQEISEISPFNLRVGARRLGSSTRPVTPNVPHSPPPTTEVSSTGATIVSRDSGGVQHSLPVRQGPKRKGYQLRSSQQLRSLRALVYRRATNQTVSGSGSSTPPPQDASQAVTHPSGYGSEPPTPPPLYTA